MKSTNLNININSMNSELYNKLYYKLGDEICNELYNELYYKLGDEICNELYNKLDYELWNNIKE